MPETRRPKVAVISHLYPSRTRENYGVFVYEQSRALVDAGCDLAAMIVPVPWAPWPLSSVSARWRAFASTERQRTDFDSLDVAFPRYISFPRKLLRAFSAWSACQTIGLFRGLPATLGTVDVIVAHTALLDGAVARSIARRHGIPYVVFVHGEDLYQNVRTGGSRLRAQVHRVLADAASVIAVSDVVRDGLLEAFPDLATIRVLHNGVDTELFAPNDTAAELAKAAPLRVLSAGHLVERKAHAIVLRAIATLVHEGIDIRYVIAGDGPLRPSLELLARELGVESRVAFTGAYPHAQLPAMLAATDLFVLPSWDEAFGVVYLESLACGVPVVAATDSGARAFVTSGVEGYLVRPRDADETASAMRTYAALDAAGRDAMREAARTKALDFTWQRNAASLLAILTDTTSARVEDTADAATTKPRGDI